MHRSYSVAIALFFVFASNAFGEMVTDQSQLLGTSSLVFMESDVQGLQSFRPTLNNITGASVRVRGFPADLVTIDLFDDFPATGNLLGTGSVANVLQGNDAVVSFATTISLIPEQSYFLRFSGSSSSGQPAPSQFAGETFGTDTYTRGIAYQTDNGTVSQIANGDFAFQTFGNAVAVPEPSSALLVFLVASAYAGCVYRQHNSRRERTSIPV